mgnify:CR=1 FL=1
MQKEIEKQKIELHVSFKMELWEATENNITSLVKKLKLKGDMVWYLKDEISLK